MGQGRGESALSQRQALAAGRLLLAGQSHFRTSL